jgi:oligopeptide transport system permease protein
MATDTINNVPGAPVLRLTETEFTKPRSPTAMALLRFRRNRLALGGLAVVIFAVVIALSADSLRLFPPLYQGPNQDAMPGTVDQATGQVYVFGTDDLGRDILSRMMFALRISLMVPIVTETVVLLVGVPIGLAAGYFGGTVDDIIMRFTDIMYAFPGLLFVIILVQVFGRSIWAIFIALGLGVWPNMARLVRGQVLQVKQMDYVLGARSIGVSPVGLMARHIFPNVLGPIIVLTTLDFPADIIAEATLTFLGIGGDPTTPSLGMMISAAQAGISSHPSEVFYPAAAIAFLTLAFSFVGDGIRDAFDPRSKI